MKLFRLIVGLHFALPFFLMFRILSVFIGPQRTVERLGPLVTRASKILGKIFMVPKIGSHAEFEAFTKRMERVIRFIKPLYDISIVHQDRDRIVLNYANCPLCEGFFLLGLRELAPYACQADWEIAKENADKWDFERKHQIGTGDEYCDHTYERKRL